MEGAPVSTGDLFHGGDRPRKAMEKRLDTLFRERGDISSRWIPRRLILQNYWLYPYQEFHFGNGRMVLRGPNGSGKTSVLVSAITLALDGDKSRSRLDPFGQAGRSIAYYLVGKKEAGGGNGGFYHEDRTGYVVLEFQHGGHGGFVTVGMGMRGRRLSGGGAPRVDSWGFVVRDGRRVGRERELELTTSEGVPLTRAELDEKVGAGGIVVERVSDYQAEVNRALFGFPEDDDHQFLMQILLALRSPKLSKELKPSDVAEILSDSLPPLDPTLLQRVTQIMDDIDATRMDIATTEANHAAVEGVHQAVARYKNQVAQEAALDYLDQQEALEEVLDRLIDARKSASTARRDGEDAQARLVDVDREIAELRGRLKVLHRHEAYRGRDTLSDARANAARVRSHHETTEAAVRDAQAAVAGSEQDRSRLRGRWIDQREAALKDAKSLARAARQALWPHAEQVATRVIADLEVLDFGAGEVSDFQPIALEELAADRRRLLEEVLDALEDRDRAEEQLQRSRSGVEQANEALKEGHGELQGAQKDVDACRDALGARLERWHRELQELTVPAAKVAEVRQELYRIDEVQGLSVELFAPFGEVADRRRHELEAEREERRVHAATLRVRRQELQVDLEVWEGREEAVPDPRPGQEEARQLLAAAGITVVPLFEAVDVGNSLTEEDLPSLQAALQESGLLDALIVRPGDEHAVASLLGAEAGDRWIRPRPLPEGVPTLAAVLDPAPCDLPEEFVRAALRSVALEEPLSSETTSTEYGSVEVGERGGAALGSDGHWRLGLIRGCASVPVKEAPVYLGREARVRERERQVSRLRSAVEALDDELERAGQETHELTTRLRRLDAESEVLWDLDEMTTLKGALTIRTERNRHVARLTGRLQEAERLTEAARRALGDARQKYEAVVRRVPDARNMDSPGVQRLIRAGEDVVSMGQRMANGLETLRDQGGELKRIITRLERQELALDNTRAREREAAEAVAEADSLVRTIETDLQELGIDEIMEEIRRAEERQEKLNVEGRELTGTIKGLEEKVRQVDAEVARLEGERTQCERLRDETRERLSEALRAYPTLAEATAVFEEGTDAAAGRAAELLLERREDRPTDLRRRIEDDLQRAWQGLTQEVSENRSVLVDYHPNLTAETGDVSFRHEGREIPPYALLDVLDRHRRQQMTVVGEKEDELYEEFFLQEVSGKIRESIERAEESVKRVNALLTERPLANEEILWLRWRPLREIGPDGADYPRLVELLRKPASVLPPEDVRWIKAFFRERVRLIRQAAAGKVDGEMEDDLSFAEALEGVLDYRRWFSFAIHGKRPGESAAEITNREFASRSGGEKALAMFVPLLAAVHARFQGAQADAPMLVGLDEAFAGVDSDNISEMFAFMVSLDLSWIMTSEKLWGVNASLPSCTTYQFHRSGIVAAVRLWLWDGRRNVDEASLTLAVEADREGRADGGMGAA